MGERITAGWSRPLRVHLAIVMVGLLIGVSGLIAGLHFAAGRKAAIGLAAQHMRVLSERLVENYRLLSAESVMFVDVAAIADEFQLPPPDRLRSKIAYLRLAVERSAPVDGAYVGYPNGEFVHLVHLTRSPEWRAALKSPPNAAYAVRVISTGEDGQRRSQWTFYDAAMDALGTLPDTGTVYDPRLRPWYRLAANRRDTMSVPPYTFATTGELGMTVARAHSANATIVFGVDVVLSTLSRFLDASQVAKGALTLVVAPDGKVMLRAGSPTVDVAPLLARAVEPGGTIPSRLTLDGQPYLVWASRVDFQSLLKGSQILVAAPLAELTRTSEQALWRDLAIALAILGLGVLIALALARRIAGALRRLTGEADSLKDLLLVPPTHVRSRITEISALGRAMTAARNAINGFGLYVPVEIVRRILDDGRFAGRSAARQEVTALFTDIAD
ncbi:adenylate/guanylate cyclase domain-containing protein, partial [Chelatococcus reniformis]|uniref:adenylate/guanylate cyclase domain-containing protein n=1 Tax=Chelatococcus reniformis TaxID=1494448 RepID=UPI00166A68DA